MHGVVPPSQHSYADYSYSEVVQEHPTVHELPQPCSSSSASASQRIVSSSSSDAAAARLGQPQSNKRHLYAIACTCVWFTCSISLTVYNKWLFSPVPHGAGFPFPVTVTTIHMFSNAGMAWLGHFEEQDRFLMNHAGHIRDKWLEAHIEWLMQQHKKARPGGDQKVKAPIQI